MKLLIVFLSICSIISGLKLNKVFINCNHKDSYELTENQPILTAGTFKDCENVTSLIMSNKSIAQTWNGAFQNMTNLKILDLSKNKIIILPTGLLSPLLKLEYIDISFNHIKKIYKNSFSNLPVLKYVNLNHNNINNIEKNSFVNVPLLKVIELELNELSTLQIDFIDNINKLTTLLLAGNPWNCDINLCALMNITVDKFWNNMNSIPACLNIIPWDHIMLNKRVIMNTNINKTNSAVPNPVKIQCFTCHDSSFSWRYEPRLLYYKIFNEVKDLTRNAEQFRNKHYTVSTLYIRDFSSKNEGNYTCYTGSYPKYNYSTWVQLNLTYEWVSRGTNTGSSSVSYSPWKIFVGVVSLLMALVGVGCCKSFFSKKSERPVFVAAQPKTQDAEPYSMVYQ